MAVIERICSSAPSLAECYLLRAIAKQRFGHEDGADADLEKALDTGLSPGHRRLFAEANTRQEMR